MKIITLFITLFFVGISNKTSTLNNAERKYALAQFENSRQRFLDELKGLTPEQLNFKAAPDKWSVEDCVKHIATTEAALWQMTNGAIMAVANPEKRSEVKATDEQVVQMIESREHKVKTAPQMEPQNTPYKSMDEALKSFVNDRSKLINYVKATDADLRNHVAALPFGSFDSYQMILFIAAHSNRHTQQIDEVKADPNFPKN